MSITYAPTGRLTGWLTIQDTITGTVTGPSGMLYPAYALNNFWVTLDSVDAGIYGLTGINLEMDVSGATAAGSRTGISSVVRVTGAVKPGQQSGQLSYVGGAMLAQADVNVGGTDTGSGAKGAVFGMGVNAVLSANVANFLNITGAEYGIKVCTGASTHSKSALSLSSLGSGDVVQGTLYDASLSISQQAGSVGWKNAILISDYNGKQPVDSAGNLIATQGSAIVTNGIDFSSYTFTGAPMIAPLQTPASSSTAGKSGSVCWDANYIYICTATNTWKRVALSAF